MKCRHCGKPIEWEPYWTTWDHTGRDNKMYAELCFPSKGFTAGAKVATPA